MKILWGDVERTWLFLVGAFVLAVTADLVFGVGAGAWGLALKEYADAKHATPGRITSVAKWRAIAGYMVRGFSFLQWAILGAAAAITASSIKVLVPYIKAAL